MNTVTIAIASKRNEFGRFLIFSLFGVFLFYNVLVIFLRYSTVSYKLSIDQPTVFFPFLATSYLCYISLKKTFDFWPIFKVITIGLYGLTFYLALLTCHRSMVPCLFYLPVLLMVLMQTSIKKAIICSMVTLGSCYFAQDISAFLDISHTETLTTNDAGTLKYLMYIILMIASYLSFLILYYYNEMNKLDSSITLAGESYSISPSVATLTASEKLYLRILDYMDTKKPYKDPGFSIKNLAHRLKSNPAYVSRALNQEGGKKFADFIQEYRIREIQIALNHNEQELTLEAIYKKAGYIHQSTFNRKFKEITGMTPSKYIESIKSKI